MAIISLHLNRLRQALFSIKKDEISRFIAFVLLMFCILFAQNLIRNIKDIVVGHKLGFEANNVLKSYGVIPISFLFSMIYIKAVTLYRNSKIFFITYALFVLLFVIYGFFLIPHADELKLLTDEEIKNLYLQYPGFKWFIIVIFNWVLSSFYILCEMWSTMLYSQLFWQLINSCSTVEQSKRFYISLNIFGQLGMVITAMILLHMDSIMYFIEDNFIVTSIFHISNDHNIFYIQTILSFIILISIIGLITLYIINKYILKTKSLDNIQIKSNQKHITLFQSLKFILNSRYVTFLFLILVCYGISINMIEGYWKSKVKTLIPDPKEFSKFFAYALLYNGILTAFFALIGKFIINKFGWLKTALITPIITLSTGILFFITAIHYRYITTDSTYMLTVVVMIGVLQNVLVKSCKYGFFDNTKEMLYVPLDHETKTKGKAVAIIGNRIGKGASGIIKSSIILPIVGGYDNAIGFLIVLFLIPCIIWIYSITELNKDYSKMQEQHKDQ